MSELLGAQNGSAATCEVVSYLNSLLRKDEFKDYTYDGLQVEGAAEVSRIGFAVDSSLAAFEALRDCQMIVVHHGLMWPSINRVAGIDRLRLKSLLGRDINLYVSHLPLDKHPQYGNNAQILQKLGYEATADFADVGWLAELPQAEPLDSVMQRVRALWGNELRHLDFGPREVHRLAVLSGGGASADFVAKCAALGVDLYITGESSLAAYHPARELGVGVVMAGHYATETFGVRALMPVLHDAFGVETTFFDCPTGL